MEGERKPVTEMTDRELIEEMVTKARTLEDAIVSLSQNPMIRAMVPGGLRLS